MRLVDIKPRKDSMQALKARIEELEQALENERERAGILSDKLDTLREEYDELETLQGEDSGKVEDTRYILDEIAIAKWRDDLGICTAKDELNNLYEELEEIV